MAGTRAKKSAKKLPTARKGPGIVVRIPEHVSEFYSNSVNVAMSRWDITLLFGSNVMDDNTLSAQQPSEVRVDAVIRMSPQHAKATARILAGMVQKYEDQFGELHGGG